MTIWILDNLYFIKMTGNFMEEAKENKIMEFQGFNISPE